MSFFYLLGKTHILALLKQTQVKELASLFGKLHISQDIGSAGEKNCCKEVNWYMFMMETGCFMAFLRG